MKIRTAVRQAVLVHAFNPSTKEFEASLAYKASFRDNQGYTEKPCPRGGGETKNSCSIKGPM